MGGYTGKMAMEEGGKGKKRWEKSFGGRGKDVESGRKTVTGEEQ